MSRRSFRTLLLGFVVAAGLCELVARGICHRRFSPANTSFRIQGDSRWQADPLAIWDNRAKYLDLDRSTQNNSYGMRSDPRRQEIPEKTTDDFWVLLVGGSAMEGMGSNRNGDWIKITGVGIHPIHDTIGEKLQRLLQKSLPDKRVRVLNAATSGYAIFQSRIKYERLRHLRPDWVVSMDGVNEPEYVPRESPKVEPPSFAHSPYRQARAVMRDSAAMFLLGEFLFLKTGLIHSNALTAPKDAATIERWANESRPMPPRVLTTEKVLTARNEFRRQLHQFDEVLTYDHQKHLLLVQPHLSLRNPERISTREEKALYHYCATHLRCNEWSDMLRAFYGDLASSLPKDKPIFALDSMHQREGATFLDDCHLTAEANAAIANIIHEHIMTDRADTSHSVGEDRYIAIAKSAEAALLPLLIAPIHSPIAVRSIANHQNPLPASDAKALP